jgi:hypothetical protein
MGDRCFSVLAWTRPVDVLVALPAGSVGFQAIAVTPKRPLLSIGNDLIA